MAMRKDTLSALFISALNVMSACSTTCPTIDCQTTSRLEFAHPIDGTYHLRTTVGEDVYEANCPMQISTRVSGIQSCDSKGVLLTGVDFGSDPDKLSVATVALDSGAPLNVSVAIERATNYDDCDLKCITYSGTINN